MITYSFSWNSRDWSHYGHAINKWIECAKIRKKGQILHNRFIYTAGRELLEWLLKEIKELIKKKKKEERLLAPDRVRSADKTLNVQYIASIPFTDWISYVLRIFK